MSNEALGKVLCVDDEPNILDSLSRTLRRRFEVFPASNMKEGLSVMGEHPDIGVILCDHVLGSERGLDFLLKAKKTLPNASRVLLSGQIDLKSLETAINSATVHKFILKPWENDQLLLQVIEAQKFHLNILEKEKLKMLSITDPVTQLTNHRFFQEKIRLDWEKHLKTEKPLSLVMIDVDHFKKFNDRFGHPEGDRFLQHIAATLKESLPAGATLSRYGGEEFVAILPNSSSTISLAVAETLRTHILKSAYNDYPLSISLGVATSPDHASSVDELIISADQSLYQAKRRGRNQTVVGLSFEH